MIKTPLSTVIGGAGIWTPGCTVIGGQQTITQLIKSLFADGTQGLYISAQDAASVSDLSSIKDLSGRNNHAAQPNSTSRATIVTDPSGYKSLKFDGIDDGYVTPSINFSNTDKVTVIAAIRKLSDVVNGRLLETGSLYSSPSGGFMIAAPASTTGGGNYGAALSSNNSQTIYTGNNELGGYVSPASSILSTSFDLSKTNYKDVLKFRINGVLKNYTASPTWTGGGAFTNVPIHIGRRGGTSLPFNGQIYAILVIGKLLDDATTAKIEKEFAKYIGVTL